MRSVFGFVTLALLLAASPAAAYIGPGAGLGAIGTVITVIGAVLLLIVGFLWYPVKRLLGLGKAKKSDDEGQDPSA